MRHPTLLLSDCRTTHHPIHSHPSVELLSPMIWSLPLPPTLATHASLSPDSRFILADQIWLTDRLTDRFLVLVMDVALQVARVSTFGVSVVYFYRFNGFYSFFFLSILRFLQKIPKAVVYPRTKSVVCDSTMYYLN